MRQAADMLQAVDIQGARVDHLVVGAGSAGCVVAGVLAEDPSCSVLLLESGPDRNPFDTDDPTTSTDLFRALADPRRTWSDSVARRSPFGPAKPYARGRGLGGSSSVNGLVCLPGRPQDYDRWERDYGCKGWGWDSVALTLAQLQQTTTCVPSRDWGRLDVALRDSARALGFADLGPHETALHDGVGAAPLGVLIDARGRAWRGSSDATHLDRRRDRPNLTIRCDTTVDRLLVDGLSVRGVLLIDGSEIEASHVTLCAGAIQSPAILLRSAIERPGIGMNLHDHTAMSLTFELADPSPPHGAVTAAVLHADGIQVTPCNRVGTNGNDLSRGSLIAASLHTYGRGHVRLRADDPSASPEVVFDSYGDERDRIALRRAARLLFRVAAEVGPGIGRVSEVASDLRDGDNTVLDEWIEENAADVLHAAGTCRMGRRSDERAVVDESATLIGYRGVSVIDASIMPELPSANPHLPIVMLATLATRRLIGSLAE